MSTYTVGDAAQRFDLEEEQVLHLLRDMGVKAFGENVQLSEQQMQKLSLAVERSRRTEGGTKSKGGQRRRKKRRVRRRKRKARKREEEEEETAEEPEEKVETAEPDQTEEAEAVEEQTEEASEDEDDKHSPEETTEESAEEGPREASVEADQEPGQQEDSSPEPPQSVREGMPEPSSSESERAQKAREARRRKAELAQKLQREQEEKLRARTRPRRVLQRLRDVIDSIETHQKGEEQVKTESEPAELDTAPAGPDTQDQPPVLRVEEGTTVAELAELMGTEAREIIQEGISEMGLMLTINQRLDRDELELVCASMGYRAQIGGGREEEQEYIEQVIEQDFPQSSRPPVVAVLGHVDHGKTSLLDKLRKTRVAQGEAGGITQHIGAYQVGTGDDRITFLDTPGHEAFTAMRARGAEITDVVVLVVAADDGVMPQTREAISHAQAGGVEMVVAINKIDLPAADPNQVKQELLQEEVVVEEFGGDVPAVEVSAKTGEGLDNLLETLQLVGEMMELKARSRGPARGVVIEGELDPGRGPLATVLVQQGRLSRGDDFICGRYAGRARALIDDQGERVEHATPGTPVQVMGLGGVSQAGDELVVMSSQRAREMAGDRQERGRQQRIQRRDVKTEEDLLKRIRQEGRTTIPLVLKADTHGSVQALADSLMKLEHEEVGVDILHQGVGGITESDVLLAETGGGMIIGFHVRPDSGGKQQAQKSGVDIRTYQVIYRAVEDVKRLMEGELEPEIVEDVTGEAEIRETFSISGVGTVAGCYVQEGTLHRGSQARLIRDGRVVYEGEIDSLKRFEEDVREVQEGYECGLHIAGYNDVKVGDRLECVQREQQARTL